MELIFNPKDGRVFGEWIWSDCDLALRCGDRKYVNQILARVFNSQSDLKCRGS